ncbi:MAG: phosphate/phosphite/phosphonate ABC transporter substrate-binding protein [Chloroflexi bacterium]|nr:phosphate/phosphite/phosphonate ABC transporter substrate-binding protein [Chloroflexota bacterium]
MSQSSVKHKTRPLPLYIRSGPSSSFSFILLYTALLAVFLLSACGSGQPSQPTPTPTLTVTPTFPPTPTATPQPLGSEENPFVIGLVSQGGEDLILPAAEEMARQIGVLGGTNVESRIYPTYLELLSEMSSGNVHVAWFTPLTYLYASQRGIAEVALLTNHFGVYEYGTQFLANVESGFQPYFDPISGLNSAGAETALQQFAGMRPCWTEPASASGYILPAGLLTLQEVDTLPAVLTQTHNAVVRALYIKGICDFGATFAISGDPRTASAVQQDLPDVMNRIFIVWRTDAVIPNLNISFLAGMSESDRLILTNAFLDLARTQEGKDLMSQAQYPFYQIDDLKVIGDETYDPLREVIEALDIDPITLIGR